MYSLARQFSRPIVHTQRQLHLNPRLETTPIKPERLFTVRALLQSLHLALIMSSISCGSFAAYPLVFAIATILRVPLHSNEDIGSSMRLAGQIVGKQVTYMAIEARTVLPKIPSFDINEYIDNEPLTRQILVKWGAVFPRGQYDPQELSQWRTGLEMDLADKLPLSLSKPLVYVLRQYLAANLNMDFDSNTFMFHVLVNNHDIPENFMDGVVSTGCASALHIISTEAYLVLHDQNWDKFCNAWTSSGSSSNPESFWSELKLDEQTDILLSLHFLRAHSILTRLITELDHAGVHYDKAFIPHRIK